VVVKIELLSSVFYNLSPFICIDQGSPLSPWPYPNSPISWITPNKSNVIFEVLKTLLDDKIRNTNKKPSNPIETD
jgi:hypothetical protein